MNIASIRQRALLPEQSTRDVLRRRIVSRLARRLRLGSINRGSDPDNFSCCRGTPVSCTGQPHNLLYSFSFPDSLSTTYTHSLDCILLLNERKQLAKMTSKCRQNYHEECEAAINKQINMELYASYCYLAMAAHFGRDDVALKGFTKFFMDASNEEREHAEGLVKYQNLRGGRVVLQPINRPAQDEWDTPLAAVEYALNLEKEVNQSLLDMHKLSSTHGDPHLTCFLEDKYLDEQAEAIRKLTCYHTNLQRVGDGLGVYKFDKELQ